jgi:hypothetical protein
MWKELLETKNLYTAELYKEVLNAEGVAVMVMPAGQDGGVTSDMSPRKLYVPDSKTHVAREILGKI